MWEDEFFGQSVTIAMEIKCECGGKLRIYEEEVYNKRAGKFIREWMKFHLTWCGVAKKATPAKHRSRKEGSGSFIIQEASRIVQEVIEKEDSCGYCYWSYPSQEAPGLLTCGFRMGFVFPQMERCDRFLSKFGYGGRKR